MSAPINIPNLTKKELIEFVRRLNSGNVGDTARNDIDHYRALVSSFKSADIRDVGLNMGLDWDEVAQRKPRKPVEVSASQQHDDNVLPQHQDNVAQESSDEAEEESENEAQQSQASIASVAQVAHDAHGKAKEMFETKPFSVIQAELARLYVVEAQPPKVIEKVKTIEKIVEKIVKVPVQLRGDKSVAQEMLEATGLPKVTATQSVKKVFGVDLRQSDGTAMQVQVWDDATAPAVDPNYVFDKDHLRVALISIEEQAPCWLGGRPGTGKTSFVEQVAARLGRHVERVNFDGGSEKYEVIGGERVKAATTVWQDGKILQGLRRPGTIILLDEPSFARPDYLSCLHAVLERGGKMGINETGEVVTPADGVTFFAADNTNGTGDRSGLYAGVREMNRPFLDRFAYFLQFEYLPQEKEVELLSKTAKLNEEATKLLVSFVRTCRSASHNGDIEAPPSLRQLYAWARAVVRGIAPRQAFAYSIVQRCSPENAEVLNQLYAKNINEQQLIAAIKGEKAVAANSINDGEVVIERA